MFGRRNRSVDFFPAWGLALGLAFILGCPNPPKIPAQFGVTSYSPKTVPTAGNVNISVNGFGFAQAINNFNVTRAQFRGFSSSTFTAQLAKPATAQLAIVQVPAMPAGTYSLSLLSTNPNSPEIEEIPVGNVTVIAPTPPSVRSVNPNSGTTGGGQSVTINGAGLTGATIVQFGTIASPNFTAINDSTIVATAPAEAAGTVDIVVITPIGSSPTSPADRYTYTSAPTIASISPTSGLLAGGNTVTITGTGFTDITNVFFGATKATSFQVVSLTEITAVAPPEAAGTVVITVVNPLGTSSTSSSDKYTYTSSTVPVVTSVSPTSELGGNPTPITITGTGFSGATTVNFVSQINGQITTIPSSSFTVNSAGTQITVLPLVTFNGIYNITVTTPSGTSAANASDQIAFA